ncbi:HAD-IA family hydrolase [Lacinutrix sp. MedPE-SW]|uniref:HAD family hydrolase n=1 Tax=Lacinutrix sp. MedPE-SW TaxID=1860087 RepID=UPI00090F71BA|nr:HAD-IA family hydrolase [Lacinutrix sp. MedPE-SW]OIQ22289.1 MAG: ABC transporter ATP-binding protein [Lacinutrix sp. MedPE-SW]
MLKAVLFDMDGVIVDTEPLHKKAYYMMFENYNINVTTEHYNSLTGQSTINVCKKLCTHFNLKAQPEELVQNKRESFTSLFHNDPSLQLLDGVLELIKNYHTNGLTLVLASSASMFTINNVFNRFNLNQYFKAKISGADLKASKPHPEIFEKAAKLAESDKHECLVIEDSTNGIKAAKAAGIYCVGYDSKNSKNQDYSLADQKINTFSDIFYEKIGIKFE